MNARTSLALFVSSLVLSACENEAPGLAGFEISTETVTFGDVSLGSQATQTVSLRNVGERRLVIAEANILPSGLDAFFTAFEDAEGVPRTSLILEPGDAGAVVLTFRPRVAGMVTARLRLDVTGAADVEISLFGTGIEGGCGPRIEPESLDFQNVIVGTTRTLSLSVRNSCDNGVSAQLRILGGPNAPRCASNVGPATFCYRSRNVLLDDEGRFGLEPGATANLEVQFTPNVAGTRFDGRVTLSACEASVCETVVSLVGFGIESGLRCRPPILDFGQINAGSSRTETVTCENIANAQITLVSWAVTQDSDPGFEVESSRPQVLNEGDTVSIEATYAPTSLGDARGTLRLETDNQNPTLRNLDVALQGSGGGPDIDIRPGLVDFGDVSLIAPARRSVLISNVGLAPLTISSIEVDTLATMSFTSPDANAGVLQPGESRSVTLEFEPRAAGEILSSLRISSNDLDASALEIPLRGRGVSVGPCQFAIVPDALDFGGVQPTRQLRRPVSIRNTGTERCLVTGVRMLPGSDPSFSVPSALLASRTIAPGAAISVDVAFAPTSVGRRLGQLEISLSNPTMPFNQVALVGTGETNAVLLAPEAVDFGVRSFSCRARPREVRIHNATSDAMRIDSVNLASGGGASPFEIASLPQPLPVELPPGTTSRFAVGFRAGTSASDEADTVEIRGVLGGAPRTWIVPVSGRSEGVPQVDDFRQIGSGKVDVLVVMDGTASMQDDQVTLGNQGGSLLGRTNTDYQVGVISSDTSVLAGRLLSASLGSMSGADVDGPPSNRIVTPRSSPLPQVVWAANLRVPRQSGISAHEAGFRAAQLALSAPTLMGHNAGFLRPEAGLSVLFVSDESEQSDLLGGGIFGSVEFYLDFFRSIKGAHRPELFSAHAVAAEPGNCTGPTGGATSRGRFTEMAEASQGSFQSICTRDWSRLAVDLGESLFGPRSQFPLSQEPVLSTLRVSVDGSELPARNAEGQLNWSYDATPRAVTFVPSSVPEPGADIRLEYRAECL